MEKVITNDVSESYQFSPWR